MINGDGTGVLTVNVPVPGDWLQVTRVCSLQIPTTAQQSKTAEINVLISELC